MSQSINLTMSKFYLTTPLYYPNARLHVGSAYTTIVCDVIARYKRMCGYDVAYLTGNDEHGEKLQRAADAAGVRPADFVAEKRRQFIEVWKKLGIDYTHFVYTDQPEHVTSVQRLIRLAQKNDPGVIYKGTYQGRYCVSDERYVSDGTDPANCDICGRPAELINEQNYFFRLSAFQDRLLELYEQHPEFVQPDFRRNEVISFVKSGLRDISISRRRLKWGVPWPDDPEEVVYVWYDALTGYMTGIGYAEGDEGSAEFQKLWPADLHMIGKDIIRFHAIYWPAFLMAAGLPLPRTIFAHGWIYYEQDKMSKSKGNVVYPEPIVDALDSFGAPGNDSLRYYLLRDTPFGQDASFSCDGLVQRYNSDLANGLGNLASRTLAMVAKYCDGVIPNASELNRRTGGAWFDDPRIDASRKKYVDGICSAYDNLQFSIVAENIWKFSVHYGGHNAPEYTPTHEQNADGFLSEYKPWAIAQEPEQRWLVDGVLYVTLEAVRAATVFAHPIIPDATRKIWAQLGCEEYLGKIEDQRFNDWKWRLLRPGSRIGKPEAVFPRLDKAEALARLHEFAEVDRKGHQVPTEKEKTVETPSGGKPAITEQAAAQPVAAPVAVPASDKISIEDFAKVEMRVGEIIAAEPIPKADKLLKIQVDIGTEVRQVCAGIAEYYQPDQLVGMKVVLVTNLQPRKLRGVESNGMIVAASVGDEGRPVLATFKEDVPKGAKLR
jgi:methionyl-tRNA synthetase